VTDLFLQGGPAEGLFQTIHSSHVASIKCLGLSEGNFR
jgi:hypothetical protein